VSLFKFLLPHVTHFSFVRIMKPNTPHVVFTPEHSIVYGGHFYSASNLQETFFGIVHCFMANDLITNTEHAKTRRVLLRIMQYFYKCYTLHVDEDGESGATFFLGFRLTFKCRVQRWASP